MHIKATVTDPQKFAGDLVAVFVGSGNEPRSYTLTKGLTQTDKFFSGRLRPLLEAERFSAKPGNLVTFSAPDGMQTRRIVIAGIGAAGAVTYREFRNSVAAVARFAKKAHAVKVGVLLPDDLLDVFGSKRTAEAVTEGISLGLYEFSRHKKPEEDAYALGEAVLLVHPSRLNNAQAGVSYGLVVSEAVSYVRDLVNESPSVTTPSYLADQARGLVKGKPGFKAKIIGREEMRRLGMGGLLAIARGSDEEPKFIRLDYDGGGTRSVTLVGKGITFDTGGLSLKPPSGMETMKLDMSGGAAVLGVFRALTALRPKIAVTGLVAATENMPSGKAVKPGDVVTAMNGKSIEILNTDAEGRVVLADALSYAAGVGAREVIDLATLTGACMVALGEDVAGLFSDDDAMRESLLSAADRSGELFWPMPLTKEYAELLKSTVADVKNIAKGRYGGAITAALFLKEFVPERARWTHLDIAGPAFAEKDTPFMPAGGTGFAVQTILSYLVAG